jgi:CelD/BcsL family acetyltransferase involved in cellulose biosynthesis
MRTQIIDSWSQIEPLASSWDKLAGPIPFRHRAWLENWWREYGVGHELFVLSLHGDDGQLVGVAPWYVEDRGAQGRTLRLLGSGEVCSEYVTLFTRPGCEELVGQAVGDWLIATDGNNSSTSTRWDQVELANVPTNDFAIAALRSRMADGGYTVHEREGLACWRLALPGTWDEYTASLSRGNRRRMRDSQKRLQKPDAALLTATPENFERAWGVLVDLHQQRWTSQGEKGCFASGPFGRFLLAASQQMLERGTLRLSWVEIGGRPAACSISMCEGGVYYVYQTGMATELLEESPGWLMQSAAIHTAIELGCRTYDLLRGNEPYKAHLGAEPLATVDLRIVSRRLAPQLRHTAWVTGNLVKSAIKSSLSTMGILSATGIVQ